MHHRKIKKRHAKKQSFSYSGIYDFRSVALSTIWITEVLTSLSSLCIITISQAFRVTMVTDKLANIN